MMSIFIGCVGLAFVAGWTIAHSVVALECRKLGGFYVGKTTYRCVAVEHDDAISTITSIADDGK